jgi:hypothetical protein
MLTSQQIPYSIFVKVACATAFENFPDIQHRATLGFSYTAIWQTPGRHVRSICAAHADAGWWIGADGLAAMLNSK